jgi:hypothetical protein
MIRIGKLAGVLVGLVLVAGSGGLHVYAQDVQPVTARPDLALSARDLPPGYEEIEPLGLRVRGVPVEDRVLRGTDPLLGPVLVLSWAFQEATTPDEGYIARLGRDAAHFLTRYFQSVMHLSDWDDLDPAGIGEQAALFSFRYELLETGRTGDGALAVFSRNAVISVVATFNLNGRATTDLRQYARIVDSRLARETALIQPLR